MFTELGASDRTSAKGMDACDSLPHPCAVVMLYNEAKSGKYHCFFGIVAIGMDACDNVSCSALLRGMSYNEAKTL